MATITHPTAGEFVQPQPSSSARAVLERAVDAAPSRIPPPRGWLRRLLARDRSARALIERYRLWPEIEYAYERITRELGPARVEIAAEDEFGFHFVALDCFVSETDPDLLFELEQEVWRESEEKFGRKAVLRLLATINADPRCVSCR